MFRVIHNGLYDSGETALSIAVFIAGGLAGGVSGYSVGAFVAGLWKLRKPTTPVFSADTKAYINDLSVTEESLKDQPSFNTVFDTDFIPDTYLGPVENYPWATQTPPTEGEQEKTKGNNK